MGKKLEICVDSLASARAAIAGGADRLEVCSALCIGGLTPHADLVRQIRKESNIELRCMIRPREGDFLYTPEEIQLMLLQIWHLREIGTDGFVFGCLNQEGYVDEQALRPLVEAAQDKRLTFHRAIDMSRDPVRAYEQIASMGFQTVLTSGGAPDCLAGKKTIEKLLKLQKACNGPEVLIGAGVTAQVIRQFRKELPLAESFHMSGKNPLESRMHFRKEGVFLSAPGLDQWTRMETDVQKVRQAKIELQG